METFDEIYELEELNEDIDEDTLLLFKDIALSTLRDIKRSLNQMKSLPKRSIDYRILAWDLERRAHEIRVIIENIIGEEIAMENIDYESQNKGKSSDDIIDTLLKLVTIAEEKLINDEILEGMAFILTIYEILSTMLCGWCISDAE